MAAAKKKQNYDLRIALVLVLLALAVVFAALAYARNAAAQPENVLRQALARSLQARNGEVSVDISNGVTGQQPSVLKLRGPVTSEGLFDLKGSYTRADRGIGLSVRSADGRDAYLKLDNVSEFADVFGEEAVEYGVTKDSNPLKRIENTWLTVPANLKDTVIYNQPVDGRTSPVLTATDKQQLAELYRQNSFLKVSKILADQSVDGIVSHHYELTVDHAAFLAYLTAVQNSIATVKLRDKQIESFMGLAQHMQNLDVWISQDDRRVVRISYDGVDGQQSRSADISFGSYNQPVIINKPERALPLFDALTGLAPGQSASAH